MHREWGAALPGVAKSPTGAAGWTHDNTRTAKLQLSQLQCTLACAEASACQAAAFEALDDATGGRSAQLVDGAHAIAARLRSCMGALAAACRTALPGPATGLSDMEFCVYTRLQLGEGPLGASLMMAIPLWAQQGSGRPVPGLLPPMGGCRRPAHPARRNAAPRDRVLRHHLGSGNEPKPAPQGPWPRPHGQLDGSSPVTLHRLLIRPSLGRARNPSWRPGFAPPLPRSYRRARP